MLERVELHRKTAKGIDLTVTFTLEETKNQDEIEYPLDGKEGEREFYTAEHRAGTTIALFGVYFRQRAAGWMRPLPKK